MNKKIKSLEDFGFPCNFDKTNKNDVFYFLTKLNTDKSGYLIRDVRFNYYFPELYADFILINFPEESNKWTFGRKLWHYLQNDFNLKLGKCPQCGKRCTIESFREGYKKYCSTKCVNQSDEHKLKTSKTKEIKYGDKNYNNRNKAASTTFERYGVDNYAKTEECQIKMKETCLEKFGTENIFQSELFKKNLIKHNIEKYGTEYFTQTDDFKNKLTNTCLEKYGVKHYSQTKLFKDKNYNTKKKNKTFNTSKIEEDLTYWFIENKYNFIRQHKSKLYPFACDFYLPDYDLYIEIQGTWTHGNHPFDKTNKEDLQLLKLWKSKNTKYYNGAIEVWTKRDPLKRKTAKDNNLNYLEVFSQKITDCIEIINNYIKINYKNDQS